ncbi:SMI1/KNR4 family protein [Sinomicrobium kalidii]|uniref:SMI1/KNR4 family protein n=1 Tax=Sinomicrobium kalidii TaxID=2900738 RepID=UPI001E4D1900|nr:SMI1/KNR4 family protein [Sinomicrobium kalidii]UGU18159.1 SMI1/KNR4 family protein [Sinomicrobium kalidii]
MKLDELMKHKSLDFEPQAFSSDNEKSIKVRDANYLEFIKAFNGGYFYNNSLILFGFSKEKNSQFNIVYMNDVFNEHYQNLVEGLYFFGQDVFGNPFAFKDGKIVFFNLESGDLEIIANDFEEWLDVLYNDLDYYTGKSLALELSVNQRKGLAVDRRLCPKYPFILGGDYTIANLTLKDYRENVAYNSDIAKQVYNLPEGSKIKIVIKNE